MELRERPPPPAKPPPDEEEEQNVEKKTGHSAPCEASAARGKSRGSGAEEEEHPYELLLTAETKKPVAVDRKTKECTWRKGSSTVGQFRDCKDLLCDLRNAQISCLAKQRQRVRGWRLCLCQEDEQHERSSEPCSPSSWRCRFLLSCCKINILLCVRANLRWKLTEEENKNVPAAFLPSYHCSGPAALLAAPGWHKRSLCSHQHLPKPLTAKGKFWERFSVRARGTSFGQPPLPSAEMSVKVQLGHGRNDHRRSSGGRSQDSAESQDIQVPEQFSGLLHGSSPICEISEDPFRLVSSAEKGDTEATSHPAAMQLEDADLPSSGPAGSSSPDPTQTVVYATVQHVSRADPAAGVTPHVQQHPGGAEPEGDRAVGRAHPGSKPKAELKLSRSLSKSDSDLLTCSPTEDDAMGSRSESLSNCSTGKKRLEKSPSFASEWDEIEKIMSSIGEGIDFSQEQHRISGSRMLEQSVGEWLESIGLQQYESKLLLNGFDDVRFLGCNVMEDQDLRDIGIGDPQHRRKLLQAARSLPKLKPLGCDGNSQPSVPAWLDSLGLQDYIQSFLSSGYSSIDTVKNLWELEIVNVSVTPLLPCSLELRLATSLSEQLCARGDCDLSLQVLKVNLLGHRKRIIASLADRPYEEPPAKPPRFSQLRCQDLMSQTSSPLSQNDSCTGRSADLLLPSGGDTAKRQHDRGTEVTPYSRAERYKAQYLGSMLIKDLRGTESTQDACAKMRKSTEHMKKIPTIILSITYKGVKFIDASNKNVIAEHEIRNISCAAQDPEDLCTFAYITKDLQTSHHYCHVFSTVDVNLTYEIILTLGQAFEVAYQLALQAQRAKPLGAGAGEMIETKSSKPVPKPRAGMRKSALDPPEVDQDSQSHASVSWVVDPKQDSKRTLSTKYETTIF
ncbi:hypothetical protein IHE44_0008399 [Lamprotornis superbus]|uniref:Ankyrin repeat and SAM domain-containing protein 1A n=1 Tax=Lamprotornis superbus TaxID=245042 RepID=A0A835NIT9_9PASS|nr:hypothetical protein IHE44_0008399 [Lamprotornis superbus]